MSQIKFEIKPFTCICGYEINHGWIGYGRTPYSISCPNKSCDLSLDKIMPSGVGFSLLEDQAVEAFMDYVDAVEYLRGEEEYKEIDPARVREYFYRKHKGWPNNPVGWR